MVARGAPVRSEEHTSELQSHSDLVCRLLLEKKKCSITNGSAMILMLFKICYHCTKYQAAIGSRYTMLTFEVHPCTISFFFNDTATTEIYTLSLHDALPI